MQKLLDLWISHHWRQTEVPLTFEAADIALEIEPAPYKQQASAEISIHTGKQPQLEAA